MKHYFLKILILLSCVLFNISMSAQNKTISGTVTDPNKLPLPGVNVIIQGTSRGGVQTDLDGRYSLLASPGQVLVFSFIGSQTILRTVGAENTYNVVLQESNGILNEVVVVGYGSQKKRNITGAVATYNANDIQDRPLVRVDQALIGQMSGVAVKQTTGVPGKGFSIRVRGAGSISAGNEPLYVLDGFPLASSSQSGSGAYGTGNPMDNINPNDIESIQVLKDAASAAIYGSRAANGVVIITTKQGKSGKPQINLNVTTGITEVSKKVKLLNGAQFIERATESINDAWVKSGSGRTATQTTQERGQILGLASGVINTKYMLDDRWAMPGYGGLHIIDWQDELFKRGMVKNYQLSISGATDNVKYYFSGNLADTKGMVLNLNYANYSARANVEVKATKNLTVGIKIAPSFSVANDPGLEGKGGLIHLALSLSPVEEVAAQDVNVFNNGAYAWNSATTQINSPIATTEYAIGQTKIVRTLGSIYADYRIIEGLNFKTTINLDNTDSNYKSYVPYTILGVLSARQQSPGVATTGSFMGYRRQTFTNENTLSYNRVFNGVHNLSVVAGESYNSDKLDNVSLTSVGGFVNETVNTLNAARGTTGSTTETKNALLSYFGRVQYDYNDKYLMSASMRRDGSSRFGENNRFGLFPSLSVGWRVSSENFMKKITQINDFKLRGSWGLSGNYNIGDYSSIPLLGTSNYTFNNSLSVGQAPIGVVNPNLSWETSKTIDFGFDISIFNNRISSSFDYYKKTNNDLLLNVPVLRVTGFPSLLQNAGSVENKGWEVEIRSRNLTGNFEWTTSLNVSHNTNKVLALAGGQTQIYIPSSFDISHSILKVGEPMYSINVVKQIGILSSQDIANHVALYGSEVEGDPKYFDANKDGKIDANDRMILGHPTPDYTWGITNSFKYKGFDMSILVQGQNGGSIYSLLGRSLNRTGMVSADNTLASSDGRWRSADDPGNGTVGKVNSTFGRIKNTDWLYSSDYYRIRDITLGYDFSDVFKSLKGNSARIFITAENFFGHDKYTGGFNPEATNTDLSGSSTFPESGDYGGMPLAKSLILGLNLNF